MTVNQESSVNAAETIRPSALTWMFATTLMLISECVYSIEVILALSPALIANPALFAPCLSVSITL